LSEANDLDQNVCRTFLSGCGAYNPLIIAEGGQNHNGDINKAKDLVDSLVGIAHAYKTQIHLPEHEMIRELMPDKYERIAEHCLSLEQEYELMLYVRERGLKYIVTCYCDEAYNFLPELQPDAIKIGSGEADNTYLFNIAGLLAQFLDVPIIRSHGMGIPEQGYENVIDMVCESTYPCEAKHFRFRLISFLSQTSNLWGYSCHTRSLFQPMIAYAFGASVLEFHVGFPGCHDEKVSWDPIQLLRFREIVGDIVKDGEFFDPKVKQWATHCYVAAEDIKKGESLMGKITTKRPGTGGLPASMDWELVQIRIATHDIEKDGQITEQNSGPNERIAGLAERVAGSDGGRPTTDVEGTQETKTVH
jgi:N,N'-diacetyllegionaminate synthase